MSLYAFATPDFQYKDERGSLIQLVREGYCQINFVTSAAGSFRGGHYHKLNRELFYLIRGDIEVTLESQTESECVHFAAGAMFFIPPYVRHSFRYLSDTEMIALYDNGVEQAEGKMDIYEVWE